MSKILNEAQESIRSLRENKTDQNIISPLEDLIDSHKSLMEERKWFELELARALIAMEKRRN